MGAAKETGRSVDFKRHLFKFSFMLGLILLAKESAEIGLWPDGQTHSQILISLLLCSSMVLGTEREWKEKHANPTLQELRPIRNARLTFMKPMEKHLENGTEGVYIQEIIMGFSSHKGPTEKTSLNVNR